MNMVSIIKMAIFEKKKCLVKKEKGVVTNQSMPCLGSMCKNYKITMFYWYIAQNLEGVSCNGCRHSLCQMSHSQNPYVPTMKDLRVLVKVLGGVLVLALFAL